MTGEHARLLATAALDLGVELGDDGLGRLSIFLGLLDIWNERIRLVGDRDPALIVAKHVVDCIAPVALMPTEGLVVDVGSGGGFPGVVIACLRPDLGLAFIESRRRPASFLREVVRSVPLPAAQVVEQRGEDAARDPALGQHAKAVISRALRLDVLLPIARELLAPDGTVIAMKTLATIASSADEGRRYGFEMVEERRYGLPSGETRALIVFRSAA